MNHLFRKTSIFILAAAIAAGIPGSGYARAEEITENVLDAEQTSDIKETGYVAVAGAKTAMSKATVDETQRVTIHMTGDVSYISEAFVRILYKGILDRTPDDQGVAEWVEVIENGEFREHVFEGFV